MSIISFITEKTVVKSYIVHSRVTVTHISDPFSNN